MMGQIYAEHIGEGARPHHAADIRGDDKPVAVFHPLGDIAHEHRRGVNIIHRHIVKSLNLLGMQIHGHQAVYPRAA